VKKGRKGEKLSPPVSVGEVYTVTIEAIGSKGDGITRIKGFVIFVPGTKVGEQVRVRIDKVLRKFAVASIEE